MRARSATMFLNARFSLYTYSSQSPHLSLPTSPKVALPFVIKPNIELEDSGVSFDITITSRYSTHALENVVAEIHLGQGAGGIRCSISRGSGGGGFINAAES
ncbi:hypothetical protein F5878DRAFT_403883 [Lentinula raphanica]|uniref:Uncharacterized protein n=1 Tax=Lentinula raphanica TaxID=153919 RepID=A0AA38UIM5_9AGAR|nr:hypothetical protein F5878DRAFT_403883 [Lentinula raphanica]